jgi:hypothetical protein
MASIDSDVDRSGSPGANPRSHGPQPDFEAPDENSPDVADRKTTNRFGRISEFEVKSRSGGGHPAVRKPAEQPASSRARRQHRFDA